jgi:hypothetical protein
MAEQKISKKGLKKSLDGSARKRGRGRPRECQYSEIIGRAQNYRQILAEVWQKLGAPLIAAQSEENVTEAFQSHAKPYDQNFVPRLVKDILAVKMEKKFPKRAMPQIKFLANSLAGRPNVECRTSRDICAKALAEEKARSPYKILRKEFYIECSCGFKGPALNDACRKCGAEIDFLPDLLSRFV